MDEPPDAAAPPAPVHDRPARLRWLPRALFEAALIGISVLLGMAASDWRDRRQARERARQALVAVSAELDSNTALVKRARLHHRAIADTLARYIAAGTPVPLRIYFGGMFNPAYVLNIAWQSARDDGTLAHLPYPLVLRLSRVYERQLQYRGLTEALLHGIYADLMVRGAPAVFRDNAASWDLLLRDFADREGTLEELYVGALPHVHRAAPR